MPIINRVSIKNFVSKGMGVISEDVPNTNRILKMFEPTIFPMAISAFFFLAANKDVNNSGKEVPRATIVSPIKRWLIFNMMAILVALVTANWLPRIKQTRPRGMKKMLLDKEIFCFDAFSVLLFEILKM